MTLMAAPPPLLVVGSASLSDLELRVLKNRVWVIAESFQFTGNQTETATGKGEIMKLVLSPDRHGKFRRAAGEEQNSPMRSWSFGSESFDFAREKMVRSCSLFSPSPSADSQACGICSMLLVERSLWTSQKIIANNELSVVAVLTCGHVYHAECLESMTPEISKYDPACPICSFGEKQTLRMSEKALRGELESKIRNKRLRNRIADSGLDSESAMLDHFINTGQQGKCPKLSSSSSLRSSSGRGFLRRHFSFGSKGGTKALPESNNTAKRKGFLWSRSTKM